MRTLFSILMTMCLAMGLMPLSAEAQNDWHAVAVDGISYIVYDNTMTAKVVPNSAKNNNYWKFKDAITIPMKIKYNDALYTVTEVGVNAFKYWQYAAFYNEDPTCGTISLPATITAIGDNAFEESGLDLIILASQTPPTLGNNPTIDRRRLMVPSGKKAAYEAAKGWKNAKEITEMVATGGEYEGFYFDFVTDGGETKARIIADPTGDNYEQLGDYINIPERVYDQKFYPVIAIDDNAFADNKVVKRINASKGVCTIGDKAFANCTQLQTLWFDNNIERIGKEAFLNCSALSKLYLREKYNFSSIGDRAFYGCSNLKKVETDNPSPFHISKDVFTGATNAVLTVPFGSKSDYEAIPGWAKLRIEEDQFVTVRIGNLYYEIDGRNSTASVAWDQTGKNYSSLTGNVTIPASVTWKGKSYPVTAVGSTAFEEARLTSVSIPGSVQVIYDYAFSKCNLLKTVTFSEGLKEIKDHAFENCVNLTEMTFPNGLKSIGRLAFGNCSHLHKIFVPESVEMLANAFGEEMSTGVGLDTIITNRRDPLPAVYADEDGEIHLHGAGSRTSDYLVMIVPSDCVMNYKVVHINPETGGYYNIDDNIWSCMSPEIIGYPMKIGDLYYTFREYVGGMYYSWDQGRPITHYQYTREATVVAETNDANNYAYLQGKTVTIPDVVTSNGIDWQVLAIDSKAFKNAPISSIVLPKKLEVVRADAFLNATRLTSVTMPSQANIGRSAFEGCTALKTVSLSSGMNSLYPSAFARCTALSDIYYMTQSPVSDVDASCFEGVNQAGVTLHVPFGAASSFSSANVWKNFNIKEGNVQVGGIYYSLNETERTAFVTYSTNSYLTGDNYAGLSGKVTIPASITYGGKSYQVTGIGYRAFFYVTGITEVQLPEGLKSIGANAFYNCPKLAKANIPSTVTEIGSSPFYGTPIINNAAGNIIYMDKCVIGSKSDNLSGALTVADGTRVIAGMAFSMCNGVTSLSLPSSVVSIGENAFQGCTAMTKADLSKCAKMTSIPNGAFTNCKALTSILLPSGVREIGSYAFFSIGATQLYLPDNVVSIGDNAFLGSKLQTLSIPSSVEKIGQEAFKNSASLSAITLRGNNTTVIKIGSNAFTGTAAASGKLTVPSGTKTAYKSADQWKTFGTIAEAYPNVNGLYYELNEDQQTAALAPDQSKEQNAAASRSNVAAGNDAVDLSEYNQTIPSLVIPSQIYYEGKNYTVTSVLPEAFSSCTSLSALVFSQKTASVGNNAFDGTSIERIELPENLTALANGTFANCAGLTKIRCRSAVPINLSGIDAFSGLIPSDITLRVPYGSRAAYEAAPGWRDFNIEEENPCIGGLYYTLDRNSMTATVSPETDDETNYRLLFGTVTIPASITTEGLTYQVTGIEPKAFAHLSRVDNLIVRQEEPLNISGLDVFDGVEIGDMTLLVPYNGMEKYPTADVWQEFMVIEPYEVQLTVEPQDPSLGTCIGSGIYEKNDSVLIEAIPAEGYRFAGWEGGACLSNPMKWKLSETDEFVTAMFEPKECIARFLDWDGTLLLATSVRYGDGVETADIPTVREGWHFTGWDENATQIFDDTDFHAQYDPDTYTVTVTAENGSVVSTDIDDVEISLIDIPHGSIVFLQAVPDENYQFVQWENDDKRDLRVITVTSDLDLTAIFAPRDFIKGDANDDGVVDVADVVAIVNYILEKPAENFNFKAADVNGDEVIDAADVVGVVNIILDKGGVNAARVRAVLRENGFIF